MSDDNEVVAYLCRFDGSVHRRGVHHPGDEPLIRIARAEAAEAVLCEWSADLSEFGGTHGPMGLLIADLRAALTTDRSADEGGVHDADNPRCAAYERDERAGLSEAVEAAWSEVSRLCNGGDERWRMSIPANPSRDSDLILATALDAYGKALAAALARAEAAEAKVAAVEALDLTGFVDTFEGERREGAASVAAFVKIALRAALTTDRSVMGGKTTPTEGGIDKQLNPHVE